MKPRFDTRWTLWILWAACCGPATAVEVPAVFDNQDTLLLAEPDITERHLAFVYDGDVWIANADGSAARRLTTAEGPESRPQFSPDGSSIAFSANYDGNVDVYLVPVSGGAPKRLTWHGGDDAVEGFDADGRVLFSSQREVHTSRGMHLFAVAPDGSFPERLPIPLGNDADASPDGRFIAYAVMPPEMFRALTQWKGYRGGSASRIFAMSVADHGTQKVPQPPGRSNDLNPMWIAGQLCFNSDRDGEFNLYSFEPASGAVTRLTNYDDFPVVNASSGGGKIVYEQAGRLHVIDPATREVTTLRVATNSDLRETRPRRVSGPEYVRNVSGSPDFDEVALEYRGEIVALQAKKSAFRNLTRSPGANDRSPAWSPGGSKIAWFSDGGGEYALYVGDAGAASEPRRIAIEPGHGFYRDLKWSPDERYLSFLDNAYTLLVADLQTGRTARIADNEYFGHQPFVSHNWSPDSRWVAYTSNSNGLIQTVHLYSITERKSYPVTDGLTEVSEPVFDGSGRYLYVIASDQAGPVKDWFSLSSLDMTFTHSLYAIVLHEGDRSPLPPEGEASEATAGTGEAAPPVAAVTIDLDGIHERIVALPTGGATLRSLQAGKPGELYYLSTPPTPIGQSLTAAAELKRFVMTEREARTLSGSVDAYHVSRDGEKLLLRQGKTWRVAPAAEIKPEGAAPLPVESVSVLVDPRQEWRQIAREAWRLNRDYFYAPGYHGADWNAVWDKYEPFLGHAATRADVGRIVSAIVSELRVGHSYTTRGETIDEPPTVNVGLLGADYEVANGRYRFRKVFGGLNWRPDMPAPLKTPGMSVADGEYLIAVEGRPVLASQNVYAAFQDLADRTVSIVVGPNPDGRDSRTIQVTPVANDRQLRYVDWVEGNLRKVDEATGGRVAYVHVPDTSVAGHASFKRYFFPQSHKQALILDERNNGGGYFADYYMDILRNRPVIQWATRYGKDLRAPRAAISGPKVMISNEGAGSGGDLLAWMFRKERLGPIVGTRTWGGLVGNLDIHALMDGATITAPNFAGWTPEDGWVIENEGVPPDIFVEETPATLLAGRDPQLEKAIEVALQALAANPPQLSTRPPYPVRVPSKQ